MMLNLNCPPTDKPRHKHAASMLLLHPKMRHHLPLCPPLHLLAYAPVPMLPPIVWKSLKGLHLLLCCTWLSQANQSILQCNRMHSHHQRPFANHLTNKRQSFCPTMTPRHRIRIWHIQRRKRAGEIEVCSACKVCILINADKPQFQPTAMWTTQECIAMFTCSQSLTLMTNWRSWISPDWQRISTNSSNQLRKLRAKQSNTLNVYHVCKYHFEFAVWAVESYSCVIKKRHQWMREGNNYYCEGLYYPSTAYGCQAQGITPSRITSFTYSLL